MGWNKYTHLLCQGWGNSGLRWKTLWPRITWQMDSANLRHLTQGSSPHPDEREVVQKKTFTKWANSHLARVSCRITDLYKDLRDGRMLIKLLEVLSGEMLVKPLPWALWLVLGPLCRKDTAWDLSTSCNLH